MLPSEVKLRVAGYETIGHLGYVEQLHRLARELGIENRVEFIGAVPLRTELLDWCRRCQVGLALMPIDSDDSNMRWMVGASNKPFDYLACGNALLVSDLPDWRETYVNPGYGLACDPSSPESIAQKVGWYLEHPEETRRMGEAGRRRVLERWNYEQQFRPVADLLQRWSVNGYASLRVRE
jgi:glycosyltransferase involved in cell wall biosynthesis